MSYLGIQDRFQIQMRSMEEFIENLNVQDVIVLFEIKSNPKDYGVSQPHPSAYCDIILNELKNYRYKSKIRIMSFDNQILEEIHKKEPSYPLIYLTYLPKSTDFFLNELSFTPYALGMFYPTINRKKVNGLHHRNIKLFAWTVNSLFEKEKLLKKGVDGIITDFPDLLKKP